jgi:hypothetical protein
MKVGIRARHALCVGVYDLALGCMYGIAHHELRTCAVSFFSHTHMCVQPLQQLNRRGGSAAHCCRTCPQLDAPNTQVSGVHSLLALVRRSGACLCMVYAIALCTGMKVGICARNARVFVFGMSACTYAWMYMTSHSVVCMGSCIVSYARALYRSSLTYMCVQPLGQLHRRGGSAVHCCSTCSQLQTPNTQVSAVNSLLA